MILLIHHQTAIDKLGNWTKINLVLNPTKTKILLFSTQQMSRVHDFENTNRNTRSNGKELERRTLTNQHLQ